MAEDLFGIVGKVVADTFLVEQVVAASELGVVYRAHHRGVRVALKCLKVPAEAQGSSPDRFLERFRAETEVQFRLAALTPTLVRPLHADAFSTPEGALVPYLALEWLDGWSLDAIIAQRGFQERPPIPLRKLVRMLTPVARALEQAHALPSSRGAPIVHGDLKPANLFVAFIGVEQVVKILNFGLGKLHSGSAGASRGSAARPSRDRHAAPEQWFVDRYGPPGTWTDVWGLALTLVEAVKGSEVFTGDVRSIGAALLDPVRRPTPRNHGVRVGDEVEAIFQKALAVDPRVRYRTVHGFWDDLLEALDLDSAGQPKWSRSQDPRVEGAHAMPSARTASGFAPKLSGLPPPARAAPPPAGLPAPRWEAPADLDALEFEPPRASEWPFLPPPLGLEPRSASPLLLEPSGSGPPARAEAPQQASASAAPTGLAFEIERSPGRPAAQAEEAAPSVPALEIPSAPALPLDIAPKDLPSGPLAAVVLEGGSDMSLELADALDEDRASTMPPRSSAPPPASYGPPPMGAAPAPLAHTAAAGRPSAPPRSSVPPQAAPSMAPRSALSTRPPPMSLGPSPLLVGSAPPAPRNERDLGRVPLEPALGAVSWSRFVPAVVLLVIAVIIAVLNQRHGGTSGGESLYLGPLRATWISLGFFVTAVALAVSSLRRPTGS